MDWSLQQSDHNGPVTNGEISLNEHPEKPKPNGNSTPQLPGEFMQLLSAAGLGPSSQARAVSPAHPTTSTPLKSINHSSPSNPSVPNIVRSSPPRPEIEAPDTDASMG